MRPRGTLACARTAAVVARTNGCPSSTDAHSLYCCAPATFVQKKSISVGSPSASSGGARSSGAELLAHVCVREAVKLELDDARSSQPSRWATTYQSMRPE